MQVHEFNMVLYIVVGCRRKEKTGNMKQNSVKYSRLQQTKARRGRIDRGEKKSMDLGSESWLYRGEEHP